MQRRAATVVCLILFVLSATGCGGGGGRSATGIPSSGNGASANRSQVPTQFKITFSSASNTASYARKPKTISPLSESAVITVNGGLQQTFNIAAPQCTLGDTITCDFTVNAYVGSDTFLIQTYSGPNGTGTLLDQVTLNFTVAATGGNSITATLGPAVSTTADSGPGSLRAAIAAANPGDTIAFAPSLSGTITLTSGAIALPQNITIAGPGASTISVSGNSASNIFSVNSGVAATISGLTLTKGAGAACVNNSSQLCGGAIQNEGTLTVTSVTFTNNVASPASAGEGGAIYNDSGATLSVTSSTFTGNEAALGGAVASESPNATIATSTFTSNTAQGTQTVPFGIGGAVYSDDDMTISGSTFTSNVATNGGSVNLGGAIVEDNCTNTGLTLTTSTLKTNQAGVPSNGDTRGDGGAVYDDSGCTAQLTGNAFTSNVASGTSDSFGGAMEADGSPGSGVDSGSSIALLGGNVFTSNSVVSQATNMYSAGGAIDITPYGSNLVISGSGNTFTSNTVTAGPSQSGGNANGGAIDLDSGGFLDMSAATGTMFSQNVASATDSAGSAFGGAIEYFVSQSCCKGGSKNRKPGPDARAAVRQRQFHAHGSAKAIARETSLRAQSTKRQPKLAIGGPKNMIIATFTQNKATGGSASEYGVSGGAIDIEDETATSFTIGTSTFTGNQVGPSFTYGGAVSSESSTFTITGSTFMTNSATNGGGAISLNESAMTLSTSTLAQNAVTAPAFSGDGGGAIFVLGDVSTVTQSTIANNTVAGSVAGTGGGAAMIYYGGELDFTNDTITGNTSTVDGGGIELGPGGDGAATITNVTLYANSATNGNGGNLYLGSGNATITNSIFARGAAAVGPDIVSPTASIDSNDWNYIATTPNGAFAILGPDDLINQGQITLAALADNGGPTQTMSDAGTAVVAVIPFSGTCGDSSVAQDQRGLYRGAVNFSCDIGAYENGGTTTPNSAPTLKVRKPSLKR